MQTLFDDIPNSSSALTFSGGTLARRVAGVGLSHAIGALLHTGEVGLPVLVISVAGVIVTHLAKVIWSKYDLISVQK
jgi:hypothetical protein